MGWSWDGRQGVIGEQACVVPARSGWGTPRSHQVPRHRYVRAQPCHFRGANRTGLQRLPRCGRGGFESLTTDYLIHPADRMQPAACTARACNLPLPRSRFHFSLPSLTACLRRLSVPGAPR
jgi:hypothetical protein